MNEIGFNEYGYSVGDQNVIHQPLYDTVEFNAATFNINAFQVPIGQPFPISAVVKDRRHTNMTQAGQLPADNAFLIKTVQAQLTYPNTRTDMATARWEAFFAESFLNLTVQDKSFLDIPLDLACGGSGPVIRDMAAGAGTGTYVTNGAADPNAVFVLAKPILLKPQVAFQVRIQLTNAPGVALTVTARARIVFGGLMARSVN